MRMAGKRTPGAVMERVSTAVVKTLQAEVTGLRAELRGERETAALLEESVAQLQADLYEAGWIQQLAVGEVQFSAEGLRQMRAICRLYALKNSLIKRGLSLRAAYVWGQGCEITARANGKQDGEQDVQAVITDLLDDPDNQRAVTGTAARTQLEASGFGTEGEVFIAAVSRPLTGTVQLRAMSPDEITDVVTDPGDASKPWFYKREAYRQVFDFDSGIHRAERVTTWYPALDYQPTSKRATIGGNPVDWTTRILHVPVNQPRGWLRGVPDAYAAIDWAAAYRDFLTDWARLMRSLSRFAWRAKTPGKEAARVKAAIAATPTKNAVTGEAMSAGATAVLGPDQALEAVSKSGATLDSDSGRPLAAMAASALDMPVTMLLGDPGVSGARATAETLDRPTELVMGLRQDLWASVYQRLIDYAIVESVRAPQGRLKGSIIRDPFTGREWVELDGETDTTVDIVFPPLDQVDPTTLVSAIKAASDTGVVPPEQLLRLILMAFDVKDPESIVEKMLDPETGEFIWPRGPGIAPGTDGPPDPAADPANSGPGSMGPDPGQDPGEGDANDPEGDAGAGS